MICYRVHKRELRPGELVCASEHFFDQLDPDRRIVEELLEKCRPKGKPSRPQAIFVFENRRDAESWAKERFTRKLYAVEVLESDVLHRADWKWPAIMCRGLGTPDGLGPLAEKYWNGDMSEDPVTELIVNRAVVIEEIALNRNLDFQRARQRLGLPPPEALRQDGEKNDG